MYLLDTNILSELIKRQPDPKVAGRFQSARAGELFTSVIAVEEICYGARIGPTGNRLWEKMQSQVLHRVTVQPLDQAIAMAGGQLRGDWKIQGTPVGYRDGLMAATALARGLILVTSPASAIRVAIRLFSLSSSL